MKILFVYQFYVVGGVETVLRNRINFLTTAGTASDILYLHDLEGGCADHHGHNAIYATRNVRKIISFLERGKYDVVISVDTPQIYKPLKKISYRPVVIMEVHTTYEDYLKYLDEIGGTNTRAIITPSNYMGSFIQQKIGTALPIYIVPNSVGEDFLSAGNDSLPRMGKKIIGWIGRFDYVKNWENFLDIAKYLQSLDNNFKYWIVGGVTAPPLVKEYFLKQVKFKGVLPHLRWFPKIEHTWMPNFYRLLAKSGGCFLSTSLNESFGMAALESMACRCPVVAPNVGGLTELLDHGSCGILYSCGNYAQAAHSVMKITTNIPLREMYIERAYHNVLTHYAPDKLVKEWMQIIRKICAENVG